MACDKPISQEKIAILAVALSHLFLGNFSILFNVQENLLSYFGVPLSASSSEVIETNVKPFVDF